MCKNVQKYISFKVRCNKILVCNIPIIRLDIKGVYKIYRFSEIKTISNSFKISLYLRVLYMISFIHQNTDK